MVSTVDRLTLFGRDVRMSRGRQLQPLVATWRSAVAANAHSLGDDRERLQFEERLKRFFERPGAVAASPLMPDRQWELEASLQSDQLDVIATDQPLLIPRRATFEDVEAERPPWQAPTSVEVVKDPAVLAEHLGPLLRVSSRAWLVDKYFVKNAELLARFLQALAQAHTGCSPLESLTVVTDRGDTRDLPSEVARKAVETVIAHAPALRTLTTALEVTLWRPEYRGLRMHERLLVTDVGAIRSDYGFDAFPAGALTSLALLDEEAWHLNRVRYDRFHPDHRNVPRLDFIDSAHMTLG